MICVAYVARPVGRGRCIFWVRYDTCEWEKEYFNSMVGMGAVLFGTYVSGCGMGIYGALVGWSVMLEGMVCGLFLGAVKVV